MLHGAKSIKYGGWFMLFVAFLISNWSTFENYYCSSKMMVDCYEFFRGNALITPHSASYWLETQNF